MPLILIVDDSPTELHVMQKALEKHGFRTAAAADGAEGVRLAREMSPDLIFMDIVMPGMNGYELCTRLRELPDHRHTPVVFITGLSDFDSRAASSVSGGSDYITKPFLFKELAVKALVYVYRHRLQRRVAF